MSFEVEQKFIVADLEAVEHKLLALGAQADKQTRQWDLYLAHPSRDFAKTDEALRVRHTEHGNYVTYKGPKVDDTTKTRRELELALADDVTAPRDWQQMFGLLGFRPVATVEKNRRTFLLSWQDVVVEIALDTVEHVGTFVELELPAEEQGVDAARRSLAALAEQLGLTESERRSYLELLLEKSGSGRLADVAPPAGS